MPPTATPRSVPAGATTTGADSVAGSGDEPSDAATNNKTMNRFMRSLQEACESRDRGRHSPLLLTKAIIRPSGDHDGTLIVPCPP